MTQTKHWNTLYDRVAYFHAIIDRKSTLEPSIRAVQTGRQLQDMTQSDDLLTLFKVTYDFTYVNLSRACNA